MYLTPKILKLFSSFKSPFTVGPVIVGKREDAGPVEGSKKKGG